MNGGRRAPGWVLFGLLALGCALALVFPAPFGGVVSSIDLVRAEVPFGEPGPGQNYLLGDAAQVFQPDLEWSRETVRDGHLPLWDPLVFGGWPLLASQQTALLYPLTLPAYLLSVADATTLRIIALLVIAALGTFLFARSLGMRWAPAAVAGLAFGLGTYEVSWLTHPMPNVYALLPWMLIAVDRTVRGGIGAAALLAAGVGLAFLGGHPQSVLIVGLLVAAYAVLGLALAARAGSDRPELLAPAGRLALAAVLGTASAAIVLIPFAELLGEASVTERGGNPGSRLQALWGLALPEVWGRPDRSFSYDPAGIANFLERTAYVGAVPALLALAGLVLRLDARRIFFVAAAGAAALLAYDFPVVSGFLVDVWPLKLVAIHRANVLLAFSVALLGGFGLDALLDADRDRLRRATAVAAAAAALPLVWVVARFEVRGGLRGIPDYLRGVEGVNAPAAAAAWSALRWAALAAAVIGLLLLLLRRERARGPVAAAAVALVALDLVLGGRGFLPVADRSEVSLPEAAAVTAARTTTGKGRFAGDGTGGGWPALIPNTGQYFGLRDARGRGVPTLRRWSETWAALGGIGKPSLAFFTSLGRDSYPELDASAVRSLLVAPGVPQPREDGLRRVYEGPDGLVYENRGAFPRAFLARGWRPATGFDDALRAVRVPPTRRLLDEPLIEGAPPPAARRGERSLAARVRVDEPARVVVDVPPPRSGGQIVLLDAYYPGWEARVDGREAPIRPANGAFRSVAVPAGARTVEFAYDPASVKAGAAISAVAWAAIAGALALAAVRARRQRRGTG